MRAWTTGLVGIVVAGLLLAALGACTSDPAGTGSAGSTGSPAPWTSEELPPLPVDPHAAMVEIRRLLVDQMTPLLTDSGQRWTAVRFLLTTSETDETAYQGFLFVTVSGTAGRSEDGLDPPERLAKAARARGWTDGGISHLLNVIRGPYHLRSTVRPGGEYRYELSTPPLSPRTLIEGTGGGTDGVPELEGYREGPASERG